MRSRRIAISALLNQQNMSEAAAEQLEYEPSPILPLGDKKYFCVEYPGYVKRTKRAIQTLGGEKGLGEALANDSTVELKYRPGDIFSHGVNGQILSTSKLLVKVTRRVKKKNRMTDEGEGEEEVVEEDKETKWKTEIKGVVTKTLRFRALADFQYLVPMDDKIRLLKTALVKGDVNHIMNYKIATDDDNNDNLRNIPPPMFTPIEGALSYGYRQNQPVLRVRVRQPDGSFKVKLVNRSRRTGFEITNIRFHEENIPTKSWHNIPTITNSEVEQAVDAVTKLFEERPIWSRFAVRNRLPGVHHPHIKTALIRNAYTFTDGPWRDCWVKYGLDPRKDQKCHIYQQVDVRRFFSLGPRPADGKTKKRRKPDLKPPKVITPEDKVNPSSGPENKHIFDGKSIPGASSLYQLCDIIDPEISPIIHNPDYLKSTTASKYCGFYYQCVIERIRKAVRKKHISLMDTGKADSIPDVENGLMAEVAKERESKTTEVEEEEGYEVIMEGEEDIEEDDDGTIASSSTATKAAKGKGKAKAAPKNKEGAIKEAQKEMNKPDSSRRLKEVVDDYMDELVKGKSSGGNDFDEDVDLDALEEYDEEEFEDIEAEDEVAGKEEEYDQGEEEAVAEEAAEPEEEEEDDEIVKPEPMSDILQEEDIPQGEDVDMKDA